VSTLGIFSKIAGVIAFPVVFGGCCGGGAILGTGALAAIWGWLGGGSLVTIIIVSLLAAYIVRTLFKRRSQCELQTEVEE